MRYRGLLSSMACACLFAHACIAQAACAQRDQAHAALAQLTAAMQSGRFIAYQPTSLQVINGQLTRADRASVTQDLKTLRTHFDSLITYGAMNGAENIPDVAAELGYRSVIVGIWDIRNAQEIANALAAAQRYPQLVSGISVGNEIWFSKRGDAAQLVAALQAIHRKAPRVPLATTEPFHMFTDYDANALLNEMDFMLANVHPVFQPWFRTAPDRNAADFVVSVTDKLAQKFCGPVLIKETGVPTAPEAQGYTPARQASFYAALRAQMPPQPRRAFAYFSAFDAPWRIHDEHAVPGEHPEEAYWGLYDERRRPKLAMSGIPPLTRQ